VFGTGPATRIYLATGSTDMRKGFERLYGLVRDRLSCDPLSGHVFLFFNFAPVGRAMCNGQILPISQNTALFSLIGAFYGGNRTSNLALPISRVWRPSNAGRGLA
jgi:hypothetical protein